MPPTSNWLPPLRLVNDGHEAHTTVEIFRTRCPPRQPDQNITLSFEAYVNFVPENKDPSTRPVLGLAIEDCFHQENVAGITEDILTNFPYFGQRIAFREKPYDKLSEELSSADEALYRIEKFVIETMEENYYHGMDVYSMELKIQQEIAISDERLRLWDSWLAVMKESDRDFENTWDDAISRPRTEEELMNMARDPPGPNILQVQLPCGHIFGDDCLKKWLETSDTCPMCRS